MEFIPMLDLLRKKYTPEMLPYHFIIPSLPGYTLSSPQPLSEDFGPRDAARIMNSLAQGLGFGDGYLVQGGDVGSRVARIIAVENEGCKGMYYALIHIFTRSRYSDDYMTNERQACISTSVRSLNQSSPQKSP